MVTMLPGSHFPLKAGIMLPRAETQVLPKCPMFAKPSLWV